MRRWLYVNLLPFVCVRVIRILEVSMSWRVHGFERVDRLYRQGRHIIIAFWHGQQLMMPLAYRGPGARILISRSGAGEFATRVVKQFGFSTIRGSTTRGGSEALRQLIRAGRQGVDLVITPDGPRGPRHVVQPGVMALAKSTGMPIVPLTFACSSKKACSSWDRFVVPYPFSRGMFLWGTPIWVDRSAGPEVMERTRRDVETALMTMSSEAEEMVRRPKGLQDVGSRC